MRPGELGPAQGAKHSKKRVGRGDGSGHGTYSGRGMKGQKARAGGGVRPGFEGGQTPLTQRLPGKEGFVNPFRREYVTVNLTRLGIFSAETEVTPQRLAQARLIKSQRLPVKILGDGELSVPLVVKAHKFTAQAKRKIEAAGGRAEEVTRA